MRRTTHVVVDRLRGTPHRPGVRRRVERIVEAQTDEVERSLYEMATGIERKIRYQGKVVGTKMEYSDYAAVKLLQARRPEVYGGGERLRGCTVAGYRRAGQRGAIVERDAPTSVHVVAEPEAAQAAIEAMQRAMLENRVEPAPPPTPLQGDVARTTRSMTRPSRNTSSRTLRPTSKCCHPHRVRV